MKKILIPLFHAFLGFTVPFTDNPVLTITGDGTPGSTVDIDVTGATPDAGIAVFASLYDHGCGYCTPWGCIHFDIGPHLYMVSKGQVDGSGEYHDDFNLPNFPPQLSGETVYFQGVEGVRDMHNVTFTLTNVDTLVLQ